MSDFFLQKDQSKKVYFLPCRHLWWGWSENYLDAFHGKVQFLRLLFSWKPIWMNTLFTKWMFTIKVMIAVAWYDSKSYISTFKVWTGSDITRKNWRANNKGFCLYILFRESWHFCKKYSKNWEPQGKTMIKAFWLILGYQKKRTQFDDCGWLKFHSCWCNVRQKMSAYTKLLKLTLGYWEDWWLFGYARQFCISLFCWAPQRCTLAGDSIIQENLQNQLHRSAQAFYHLVL